ncbi:MAG: DUF1521 domain-containing protein [Chitinivibrionales bacterium]|nr:DUF1521 domain-containing protein [Chitinivibrionales bacterium]MBD3357718.1 DUF1521 domain-containing protein [Chitinivibrionales bacterium]
MSLQAVDNSASMLVDSVDNAAESGAVEGMSAEALSSVSQLQELAALMEQLMQLMQQMLELFTQMGSQAGQDFSEVASEGGMPGESPVEGMGMNSGDLLQQLNDLLSSYLSGAESENNAALGSGGEGQMADNGLASDIATLIINNMNGEGEANLAEILSAAGMGGASAVSAEPETMAEPTWQVNHDENTVQLDNGASIEFGKDNIVITDTDGEKTRIYGDPHIDCGKDGTKDGDFWEQSTFALKDGTKITIATTEAHNGNTYSEDCYITKGDQAVQVSGIHTGKGEIEMSDVTMNGEALDASVNDGHMVYDQSGNNWKLEDGTVFGRDNDKHVKFAKEETSNEVDVTASNFDELANGDRETMRRMQQLVLQQMMTSLMQMMAQMLSMMEETINY